MTERTCVRSDCELPCVGRGMCRKHYNSWAYQTRKDPVRRAALDAELAQIRHEREQRRTSPVKQCTKCGSTRPKTEFSTAPGRGDGYHSWCKACCRVLANALYDSEKARARHAAKRHDPTYQAAKKAVYDRWRAQYPERAKLAYTRWRAANPVRVRETNQAWRAANADRVRISKRVTRQRRRAAMAETSIGPVRLLEILDRDGMVCHLCRTDIGSADDLHFDHVVPLSRGGSHTMGNIKPAHAACNLRKHDKLVSELDWVVVA